MAAEIAIFLIFILAWQKRIVKKRRNNKRQGSIHSPAEGTVAPHGTVVHVPGNSLPNGVGNGVLYQNAPLTIDSNRA